MGKFFFKVSDSIIGQDLPNDQQLYNYLQLISNNFGKLNFNGDMQSDLGLNANNFQQQNNLSLDMNIGHILDGNDMSQSALNFNLSNLVIDGDNNQNSLVDYSNGMNHNNNNVLRQFNELHISGSNLGYKKEMVSKNFWVKKFFCFKILILNFLVFRTIRTCQVSFNTIVPTKMIASINIAKLTSPNLTLSTLIIIAILEAGSSLIR